MAKKFLGYNRGLHSGAYTVEGSLSAADMAKGFEALTKADAELTKLDLQIMEKGAESFDKWDKWLIDSYKVQADLAAAQSQALAEGQGDRAKALGDALKYYGDKQTEVKANGDTAKAYQTMVAGSLQTAAAKFAGITDQLGNYVEKENGKALKDMSAAEFESSFGADMREALTGIANEVLGAASVESTTSPGKAIIAIEVANDAVEGVLDQATKAAGGNPEITAAIEDYRASWRRQRDNVIRPDIREAYEAE